MTKLSQQLVAEFLGAFALVFIGAGAVVLAPAGGGLLGVALAHGLVLAVMVSGLGHISGGHFNPAVTIGIWVAGKIETFRATFYVILQLAGAAAGAFLLRWALPSQLWEGSNLGVPEVNGAAGISVAKGILLEAILTFFLVLVVFAVAVDERGTFKSIAGLPIGLVLTFDILVGGPLTGAAMNPARWFGPALASGGTWNDAWVWVIGPVTGGVIAASLYWLVFLRTREIPVVMEASEAEVPAE